MRPPLTRNSTGTRAGFPWNTWPERGERISIVAVDFGRTADGVGRTIGGRTKISTMQATVRAANPHASHAGSARYPLRRSRRKAIHPRNRAAIESTLVMP